MQPSKYQQAIYDDVANGTGHTMVIARAGSGKTTTALQSFKHLPRGKKTLMVAFNRSIAKELRDRSPSYVDCSTMHSLGLKSIRRSFGEVDIDKDKCKNIVEEFLPIAANNIGITISGKNKFDIINNICQCISLCKSFLSDLPKDIESVIEDFGIETFDFEISEFVSIVIKSMGECKKNTSVVDFDDMIWFPFVFRLKLTTYDYVFVDEAQDLNKAQMFMVLASCKKDGRIFAIGDPAQAIYKFRGADSFAMDILQEKLNAKILKLPITYRCSKRITYLAQKMVPDISPSPNAEEGEIINVLSSNFLDKVNRGDFVLSRTNAPLIKYCLILLKRGIPANIQGRDIGKNLIHFVNKSKKKTVKDLVSYTEKWRDKEIKRVQALGRPGKYYKDKAECIFILCENSSTTDEVINTIKELFEDIDNSSKVVFSTTHKAKGLERSRVFILEYTYRYNSKSHNYGEENEERNIFYVAITRAKNKLFLVKKN